MPSGQLQVTGDRSWVQDVARKKDINTLSVPAEIARQISFDSSKPEEFAFSAIFSGRLFEFSTLPVSGAEFKPADDLAAALNEARKRGQAKIELELSIEAHNRLPGPDPDPLGEAGGAEGTPVLVNHMKRERRPWLIRIKKNDAIQRGAGLACEVCGFEFARRYGDLGMDFIEVHHLKPLSALAGSRVTDMSDLVLICSNCHRMAHRLLARLGDAASYTLAELRDHLNSPRIGH